MADKEVTVSEHSLCCSICLEYFKKPRTLPCQHSFCSDCLTGYVEKVLLSADDSKLFGFNCPVCRRFVHVHKSDNNCDVVKWVDSFPVNYTLLSILDSRKDKMPAEIKCDGCSRSNLETQAQFYCCQCEDNFCEDCKLFHSRIKSTMHHNFIDISENQEAIVDILNTIRDFDKCPRHRDSGIKYCCRDHDEHCCERCAIVKHRKCDNLIAIEDLVEESDTEKTTEQLSSQLDMAIGSCDELSKFYHDQEQKLERSKLDIDASIEHIREIIIKLFDDFKNRLEKEFEMKKKNKIADISTTLVKVAHLRDGVNRHKKVLEMAKKFGSRLQHLFATLKIQDDIEQSKTTFVDVYGNLKSETLQMLAHSQLITNVKQALETIHIDVTSDDDVVLPKCPENFNQTTLFHQRQAILEHEMTMEGTGAIDGCVVLPSNKVVISSRNTNSIILLDLEKKTVLNTYNFSSQPWNMKQIGQNETKIGVTFPKENKVRIIEVGGSITCLKDIQVSGECYGLAYCSATETLFTLSRSSGEITRYKLDGTKLSNLPLSEDIKSKVRNAYCLAYSNQQKVIIVSCFNSHSILAITTEGNVTFECNCGKYPWEIAMDTADNMYVCLWRGDAVQQYNKSGQIVRDLLTGKDGITQPKAIAWSNNFNSFVLVTNNSVMRYKFEQ